MSGLGIDNFFPTDKWEDFMAEVQVLGVYKHKSDTKGSKKPFSFDNFQKLMSRPALPTRPGSKVFVLESDKLKGFIGVDKDGLIDLKELKDAITDDTCLVSIIYANNEIGTVQDLKSISEICKKAGVALHTDACQATSYLDIDVESLGVDMMTLNGSKIYGPKGIGVLYKREGIEISPNH